MLRPALITAALLTSLPAAHADEAFRACLAELRGESAKRGVQSATFDRHAASVEPDMEVIALLDRQPEFTTPIWDYLAGLVDDERVRDGRAMLERWRKELDLIERDYGVDRAVVVAVWGVESNYGGSFGKRPVVRSLATLACIGRRQSFFRGELFHALKILEDGHIEPEAFTGSWAGAFGHTQFMPSTFLRAARSGTGGQRIDLMGSVPDALMSTGNLLRAEGWQRGQGWGYEVVVPANLDFTLAGRDRPQAIAQWEARGVKRTGGRAFPRRTDPAFLHLPAGARGPAFLMLPNFRVIMKYNNSENYAMAVGHLADRLRGGGGFAQAWPTGERALSQQERIELQQRLAQVGFYTGTVDGKLGAGTREALQRFQARAGMPADGFPTAALLQRLRRGS